MLTLLSDLIHLTDGELFVKYWWLWLSILALLLIASHKNNRPEK